MNINWKDLAFTVGIVLAVLWLLENVAPAAVKKPFGY